MKKVIILFVISIFLFSCYGNMPKEDGNFEIAVLIDLGSINDRSFNQSSWEGAEEYAKKNGISCQYYKVPDNKFNSYMSTVELAVECGAKLIVTPGYMFEYVVYKAQDIYTNVNFVLIDGVPHDGTYTHCKTRDNTIAITYAEEQAGFLAGYAVVKEGYTNLGVIGGVAHPNVVRFGYGFIQGADYAAKELEIENNSIDIKYTYVGNYDTTTETQVLADSWYKEGVQVIFAPAGGAAYSVMRAAENNNGLVVGVDVDQSFESKTVITSAMKMVKESVYNAVFSYYNNNFYGGRNVLVDAKSKGIGLPIATSKFKVFTESDYNNIYNQLISDNIKILKDTDVTNINELPLEFVKVNYIE